MQLLTLITSTQQTARHGACLPADFTLRSMTPADVARCAPLYLAAYPRAIVADLAEAEAEMTATAAGEYGPLDFALSCLIEQAGKPVCAVMTVDPAPWPDTPPGPFIIEVFTDPAQRGRGLARAALVSAAQAAQDRGKLSLALRVNGENQAALALYTDLGFICWQEAV